MLFILLLISSKATAQCGSFVKTYMPNYYAKAFSMIELKDSTFIVAGFRAINIQTGFAFFMKIDACGDSLWNKEYQTEGLGSIILPLNDTTLIAFGGLSTDPTHDNNTTYITMQGDTFNHVDSIMPTVAGGGVIDVRKTNDGGFASAHAWGGLANFIKWDSLGNLQWWKNTTVDYITQDIDGGYVGASGGGQALKPYYIKKFDSLGNLIWSKAYGNNTSGNVQYGPFGIAVTPDSNYITITEDEFNHRMFKVNRNFPHDTMWTKSLPYFGGSTMVQNNNNGNIFSVGNFATLSNSNGDVLWSHQLYVNGDTAPAPIRSYLTKDGGYIVCGEYVFHYGVPWDIRVWVQKFDSLGNTMFVSTVELPKERNALTVFPNPATTEIEIALPQEMEGDNTTITIYDAMGSLKFEVRSLKLGYPKVNIAYLPNGVYFVVVNNGNKKYRTSFVKME